MAKVQSLSVFASERLTVAEVEILGVMEKVVEEYQVEISQFKEENDRLGRLLRITPGIKQCRIYPLQFSLAVSEEEDPPPRATALWAAVKLQCGAGGHRAHTD